ncbi:MAG: hypothetical protein H5U40_02800 [Polyangiaceae bacterium]|nr:hypothetical protein [Polyangiaceae bacterium]
MGESRFLPRLGVVAVLAAVVAAAPMAPEMVGLARGYLRANGIGSRTVPQVLAELGPVDRDLGVRSEAAGVRWPPARTTWLAFKEERRLEAWVAGAEGGFVQLATYPILAASGETGPKRREGDEQVPEGFYRLTALNPNSRYHLSVRVDYPNEEDITHRRVSRSAMGGDIFVHGSHFSIGCIAVGDRAIEELFVLAARVPAGGRRILIAPVDFRSRPEGAAGDEPWVRDLYVRLREALGSFAPAEPTVAPEPSGP